MLSVDKQFLRNNQPRFNHKKRGRPPLTTKKTTDEFFIANPARNQIDFNLMTQPNNGFDMSAVQFGAESSEVTNEA